MLDEVSLILLFCLAVNDLLAMTCSVVDFDDIVHSYNTSLLIETHSPSKLSKRVGRVRAFATIEVADENIVFIEGCFRMEDITPLPHELQRVFALA